ncbi:uncharacterized protein C20orf96-like isoform X3 [Brachyhypopomus gauderio]|uniref:uncharacterized protein C20orf96-like isoform X3 n=1 Tax=Brachyhypopomus gauderio TaxID=698409 RepID=UPI004042ADD7
MIRRKYSRSQKRAVEELEEHCKLLEDVNQQGVRDIEDTDRQSVSRARELLIQYAKLGRSGAAYSKWSTMQITQARAELRDTVQEAKNQLSGLQVKLEAVMAQVLDARTELHTLKTYKDKEYPVKALQIANMKVDLDKLQKAQQDECDDVSVLCQTEMASLEKQLQQKEQEVLSAIAKQSVSCVPPLVKHMVLHNHTMKREIKLHKQEIMELEEENSALLRNIQALQLLRPNCSKEVFNVFPKSDRCDPDIDVHLSVKRHDCLPI